MSFQYSDEHTYQSSVANLNPMDQPLLTNQQPAVVTTTTVFPSATTNSSRPVGPNADGFIPHDNNSDFVVFTPAQPTSLPPFKDPRVWIGLVYLAGVYWEFQLAMSLQWHSKIEDLLTVFAWFGVGIIITVILYSCSLLTKILNINSYITRYPTKGLVLIPSRHRSAQSLRKAIPCAAMINSFVIIFVVCDRLVRCSQKDWDWESKTDQLLVGIGCNHLIGLIVASFATMVEFRSGWEWARYYHTNRPTTHPHSRSHGNIAGQYPVHISPDGLMNDDYSSQAYVAMSFSHHSNHHQHHLQTANGQSLPFPLPYNSSNLSNATAPQEGYVTLSDTHSLAVGPNLPPMDNRSGFGSQYM